MVLTDGRDYRIGGAAPGLSLLMQGRFWVFVTAVCAAVALTVSAPAIAKPPPRSFFGVDTWSTPSSHELNRMSRGKVGVYRYFLNWSNVEQCGGCRDWSGVDKLIGDAARNHVRVLPYVYGSPSFLESKAQYPPLGSAALKDFAAFMHDLAARYGTSGSFWRSNPTLPKTPLAGIQVWNEPSHPYFWSPNPKASQYVKLLKAAAKAIRSADRGTKVVLAGIPNVGGKPLLDYVKELYGVSGFRKAFDVMAIHPYAIKPADVYYALRQLRSIMTSHGDGGKQTWITEIGWASNHAKYFGAGSPKGQANVLTKAYKGLIKRRKESKLGLVVWFTWRDRKLEAGEKNGWVTHTGLFQTGGKPKPAWGALVKITGGKAGSGSL